MEQYEVKFRTDGYKYTSEHNGQQYIEFHVDDVPDQLYDSLLAPIQFGGYCSVQMEDNTKQLIYFTLYNLYFQS